MQTKSILVTLLTAAAMAGAGFAGAADTGDSKGPAGTMTSPKADDGKRQGGMMQGGGMMHGGGMHGSGMEGMMGMMNQCGQMMGSTATPHLPAGYEKLQLQMQAEIMQKTAEILARYADRIGPDAKKTQ